MIKKQNGLVSQIMKTIWIRVNLIKLTRGKPSCFLIWEPKVGKEQRQCPTHIIIIFYIGHLTFQSGLQCRNFFIDNSQRKTASGRKTSALANRDCWEFHGNRTVPQESSVPTGHMIIIRLKLYFCKQQKFQVSHSNFRDKVHGFVKFNKD